MKFRDLSIYTSFDWLDDANPMHNNFYLRCVKISARKYRDEKGTVHRVGTINAEIFHPGTPGYWNNNPNGKELIEPID